MPLPTIPDSSDKFKAFVFKMTDSMTTRTKIYVYINFFIYLYL